MLYFNLHQVFKVRQIERPYTFLVKIGIAPHTATKILNDYTHVMRLKHVEMICKALYCEPNDLLAYKPDKNFPLPEKHPLLNLIPKEEENNWQEELKTMPLSKLKEITKLINRPEDQE